MIEYRGFEIRPNVYPFGKFDQYHYQHKDYDPTPIYADDGPCDNRAGYAASLADARVEIDDRFFDGERPLLSVGEWWDVAAIGCAVVWGIILGTYFYWS